jgi:D-alanyl-D-alanine carboxypeptidase
VLFGRSERDRREIASLTKIMTWYTCVRLADILQIDLKTEIIKIDSSVTEVTGTTANL